MQSTLKCLSAALLFLLCHTACRKAETPAISEKVSLASEKATTNDNSCCRVSLNLTGGGMSITVDGTTYHYSTNVFDTAGLTPSETGEYCLAHCIMGDNPPMFEVKNYDKFFTAWGFLAQYSGVPAPTCPPYGSQCLWTREQMMYASGGNIGYETSAIGHTLDDLTNINTFMPRIEAEDPVALMAVLEKLKCRFFRRYSGADPEIAFQLAEEGNFVIAIYANVADNTDDGWGSPLPTYSRAAVLQPGWNDRLYITWGQAATSVVRPFWGSSDYYATEDFYNGAGVDPSKFFFYVYTPDQCTEGQYSCP
ncbi:hypothetical protein [Chitinophaga sp. YIM B06452]|uniref:hypothetical protein n=1 Tax=Chitinophaga sp. YIM B06452 TaxID=3082158 RepID=UPI0031FF095C